MLGVLAAQPKRARLLVTSRYPFVLPGHRDRVLVYQAVGPLSPAETMKLAWALPGLDRLSEPELARVNQLVGGHPRCLEYVDALLCGGTSRYPDVTARLLDHLAERPDVPDLDDWLGAHSRLEPAVAAAVTRAADEVLLDRLLAQLAAVPGAEDLLLGLSVHRREIDRAGLLFQSGSIDADAAVDGIEPHPPRRAPDNLEQLVQAGIASSLLSVGTSGDQTCLFVHRWTATELAERWTTAGSGSQIVAAHLRAAEYWQWRVKVWPQDRGADVDDLTEARHHLLAAGRADQANDLSWAIAHVLHSWGAWDREDALIRDTLAALPDAHVGRSNWIRQLADTAHGRGRVGEANQLYRQALTIDHQLVEKAPDNTGFQRGLSVSYERLGDLAREAGDRGEAARLYREGLGIAERLVALAPDNTGFQRDLWVSVDRLADLAADQTDAGMAIRSALQSATDLLGYDHPLTDAIRRRIDGDDGPSESTEVAESD